MTSAMVSGASIHDESFEDDFSDMEGDGSTGLYMYVHACTYICHNRDNRIYYTNNIQVSCTRCIYIYII